MSRLPLILSALLTLLVGFVVQRAAFDYFSQEEWSKAQGQLSLYRSTVVAELEQHSHLTHILARDTFVTEAVAGAGTGALNQRLEDFAKQAGLESIYLMDANGVTIAASNHATDTSFVGHNYGFRPYFKDALQGKHGRFYAIGMTTGLPGLFLADGVVVEGHEVAGVIAIKKGFSVLEDSWRRAGEQVILTNNDGVVLLASDPTWRYRALRPLTEVQKEKIGAVRQFSGQPLNPLQWRVKANNRAVIGGDERMHLVADDLPDGWQLHYFADDDRAVARSWLATAAVVFLAGSLMIVFQVQRARRVGRALKRAVKEEAQLRTSNLQLAKEVAERKATEERLQKTQKELEQASRLAALGQLSASVTHELGQPIAAMRNHLAAAEINPKNAARLGPEIGGLVGRMEGITRQLKFFATSGGDAFEVFDLREAMQAGLSLLAPNIEKGAILVDLQMPEAAVWVRGNRLRLEQVITNVLRNACDAMEEEPADSQLSVYVGQSDAQAFFEVLDTGHGLGTASLADLQEPFVTTRESGRGMGLGLAISASIIKDHDGTMSARARAEGGAVFRVMMPLVTDMEDEQIP
ncbi:sensor histidine kinase [Shimia sagamensis]|uniref:histidine kinase n=1 Tax=Shimia sagamensis TaxID=1566352 RepID=A0ABY1NLN0_9RHOB|nr:ATP-binding protein [Shimia sagamensis]SMP12712.1 two-component system, NtrC family, C4-dicarboxylate transport sensor histidine kinase DctB [Shimia sagamensis]